MSPEAGTKLGLVPVGAVKKLGAARGTGTTVFFRPDSTIFPKVEFDALPALFPGHTAPIIKQSSDGERELVMRSWGFVLLRDG